MKKLDTTFHNLGFPVKAGTWDFLQLAYQEGFDALCKRILDNHRITYSASTAYVLYGCISSVAGGNTSFTAGTIYFNGEIFLSPAQTIATPSGGNVIVASIDTTQYTTNADTVTYGDGSGHNVHNIRQCKFAAGSSGSGSIANYSSFLFVEAWVDVTTATLTVTPDAGTASISAAIYSKYRIEGNTLKWRFITSNFTASNTTHNIVINYPFAFSNSIGGTSFVGFYVDNLGVLNQVNVAVGNSGVNVSRFDNAVFGVTNKFFEFTVDFEL